MPDGECWHAKCWKRSGSCAGVARRLNGAFNGRIRCDSEAAYSSRLFSLRLLNKYQHSYSRFINSLFCHQSTTTMNFTSNQTNIPPNGIGALPFTPLLAPNAIFTTIFTILFTLHVILAFFFRKYYGYAIGMVCGLLLEMLGYIAKVQLAHSRTNKNGYIMCVVLRLGLELPFTLILV